MLSAPFRALLAITPISDVSVDSVLVVFLALAGIGSVTVFALAILVLRRRRSKPYLLIVGALGALVGRTVVGLAAFFGVITIELHHVLEHGLDVVIALLLLGAIYAVGPATARSPTSPVRPEHEADGGSE